MKTWTMPKVEIEGFSANEYVAASCGSTDPVYIESGYYYYLDYNKNGNYDGGSTEDATHPEGSYGTGMTNHLAKAVNQPKSGWQNNINLYRRSKSSGGYNGTNVPYQESDWLGTYDLYIIGANVYLYKSGVYDGDTEPFDPSASKPFS